MDRCTFVNGLCPTDLCVLPYGHPFTRRHKHITGTVYGSADTSYEDQLEIMRNTNRANWDKSMHYIAPKGTSDDELVKLGWKLQDKLFPAEAKGK